MEASYDLKLEYQDDLLIFKPLGNWTLKFFEKIRELCANNSSRISTNSFSKVEIDGINLKALDTTGAYLIYSLIDQISKKNQNYHTNPGGKFILLKNFDSDSEQLFNIVTERMNKFNSIKEEKPPVKLSFLGKIGESAHKSFLYLYQIFNFFGLVSEAFVQMLFKIKLFRTKELISQLEEACVKSIPVVSLVTFLIGVVVAYLMAMQIEKYGGHIFVVNGVAIAMCRELSPIIVAIVMAGRSGSAYTAQLGAMRLNEEVDAIVALGLSTMHVLVIPRLLALVFSVPLLVFIGDLVGIAGGMFIAESYLGLSYSTFIDRLHSALPIKHFIVGMIKAPVFAAVIALIGCRRGLTTEMNARSVGLSTTATVVESIVLVILLNAGFAVVFANLGI